MFHSVRSLMIRRPISDVQISSSKPGADAVQPANIFFGITLVGSFVTAPTITQ